MVEFAKCALEDKGDTLKGKRCLITGSGKVSCSQRKCYVLKPREDYGRFGHETRGCRPASREVLPKNLLSRRNWVLLAMDLLAGGRSCGGKAPSAWRHPAHLLRFECLHLRARGKYLARIVDAPVTWLRSLWWHYSHLDFSPSSTLDLRFVCFRLTQYPLDSPL